MAYEPEDEIDDEMPSAPAAGTVRSVRPQPVLDVEEGPEIGTTGGVIPKQAGTWNRKPMTAADLSPDLRTRRQQVREEVDRRQKEEFEKAHPFTPTGWQPPTPRIAYRQGMQEGEEAYGDYLRQQRALAVQQRRDAAAQLKEQNAQAIDDSRSTGKRYQRNPRTGVMEPMVDRETGRQLYAETDWQPAEHPKDKRPVRMKTDKFGQRQFKDYPLVASPDPLEGRFYYDIGDGESVAAMTFEEAAASKDVGLAQRGKAAMKRKMFAERNEAISAMQAVSDTVAMEYNTAVERSAALKARIEALQMGGGDPREVDALTAQQIENDALIDPSRGPLALRKKISERALATERIKARRDAYLMQRDELATRLAAQGIDPMQDPTFRENEKALAAFEQGYQAATKAEQEIEQLMQPVQPVAGVAPQEVSALAETGKSLARGATSEGLYAAAQGAAELFSQSPIRRGLEALEDWATEKIQGFPLTEQQKATRARLRQQAAEKTGTATVDRFAKDYAKATGQLREEIRRALPVDEKFAQSKLGQIAQGVGQLAGTAPMAAFGPAGIAAASVGQIYDEAYQDAKQSGQDDATAHRTAMKYLPAAGLDFLSDRLVIGKLLKPLVGKMTVGAFLKDVLKTGAMEGATEAGQQLYLNQIAKSLEGYDPNRPFDKEVMDSALVGFVVGSGANVAGRGIQKITGGPDEGGNVQAPDQPPVGPTGQQATPQVTPPVAPQVAGQEAAATPSQNFPTDDLTEAERAQAELEAALAEDQVPAAEVPAQPEQAAGIAPEPVSVAAEGAPVEPDTVQTPDVPVAAQSQEETIPPALAQEQPVSVGEVAPINTPEAQPEQGAAIPLQEPAPVPAGDTQAVTPEPVATPATTVATDDEAAIEAAAQAQQQPAAKPIPEGTQFLYEQNGTRYYQMPDAEAVRGSRTVDEATLQKEGFDTSKLPAAPQAQTAEEPKPKAGMAPIVTEMAQVAKQSASELRKRITDVKLGPIENDKETIVFMLDGKPMKGVLTGRNRDLVLTGDARDAAIATRVLLDNQASPITEEPPNALRQQPAAEILQRQPNRPVEAGSERGRVEQGQQGQEPAGTSQAEGQAVVREVARTPLPENLVAPDAEMGAAQKEYNEAVRAYRAREIGDTEYLAARDKYKAAQAKYDAARGEAVPAPKRTLEGIRKQRAKMKAEAAPKAGRVAVSPETDELLGTNERGEPIYWSRDANTHYAVSDGKIRTAPNVAGLPENAIDRLHALTSAPVRTPEIAPAETSELQPPAMMKRDQLRAELKAAGVETVSGGVPVDQAAPNQLMAAVGKLRQGKLEEVKAAPDKIIAALQNAKFQKPGRTYAHTPLSLAWDSAIDLAILAVRAGRAINEVVQMGVNRFKARYPQHTPEDLTKLEAAIRKTATEPLPPRPTKQEKSRLPESYKAVGVPAETLEYEVRNQAERKREAADIIKRDGREKAEAAIEDKALPRDTRVAIGGELVNERMLALKDAKPEDVDRISRDIRRIVAKMRPELATESGQAIAMFNSIYEDAGVAAATEYVRNVQAERVRKMGGEDAEKAAKEAAAVFNNKKLTDAQKQAQIEELKKKFTTKPVTRMLNELKRVETVKKLNELGVLTDDDMLTVAGNALGIPGISQNKLKHLAELADRIKNAKNHAEKSRAELELADALSVYKGIKPADLETSILTLNILSGYTTQLRNLAGNTMQAFSNLATTAATNPKQVKALVDGLMDGIGIGKTQAKSIWETGRGTRDFQDKTQMAGSALANVDYARDYGLDPKVGDILTKRARLIERISRFMRAADAVFYYPAREAYARMATTKLLEGKYQGEELARRVKEILNVTPEAFAAAERQAKSEGYDGINLGRRTYDIIEEKRKLTDIGKTATEQAEQFGAESTFTNEPVGFAGIVYRNLNRLVQESRIGGVQVLKPWMMFLRTPSNVFNASLNYTPLGGVRAKFGVAGEKQGTWKNFNREERNRLYLQSIIGTSLMGGILMRTLMSKGDDDDFVISAGGPSDPNKRRQLINAGWKPYSIKVGKNYLSYRDSPLLIPLAIVGNVADAVKYKKSKDDLLLESRVADAVAQAPQIIFQTSMLSGLADLMSGLSGGKNLASSVGRNLAGIPANLIIPYNRLLQQIDQTFDPKQRERDLTTGNIPFVRRMGEVRTDVQGRPETYTPIEAFGSRESNDPVDKLLIAKDVFIPDVAKNVKLGNREMTEDERTLYRRMSGQRVRARILASEPFLKNRTPEAVEKEIDKIVREERERVRERIRISSLMQRKAP